MRDDRTTAMERLKIRTTAMRKVAMKPGVLVVIASVAMIAFISSGVVAMRMIKGYSAELSSASKQQTLSEPGVSVTTTSEQPIVTIDASQSDTSTPPASKDAKGQTSTSVTVNNQPIDVPENGTVHKTIQSPDGTSSVSVSVNSNSSENSSSTYTSTNFQSNTNNFTQNSNYTSSTP